MQLETAQAFRKNATQGMYKGMYKNATKGMYLRAFNLAEGMVTPSVYVKEYSWVIVAVLRDPDRETLRVSSYLHGEDVTREHYIEEEYNFCDEVLVTGYCVNPLDVNDTDFGV